MKLNSYIIILIILLLGYDQSNGEILSVNATKIIELKQKIDKINVIEQQYPNLIPVMENQKIIINSHINALEKSEVQ